MNVCALIPSYNPDERLVSTAEDLRACGFRHIIAVDDGSRPDCQPYFQALERMDCKVVRLPQNSGKGEALKLGFLAFLTQGWADAGVVTVDGDGQHSGRRRPAQWTETASTAGGTPSGAPVRCSGIPGR